MLRYHTPIMLEEVLRFLEPKPGGVYLDGTLGTGGHAEALLEASAPDGRVIGIDADPETLEIARERLSPFGDRLLLLHGRYEHSRDLLLRHGIEKVHGVLLDLGISRVQLELPARGFSFSRDDPLDMRMDRTQGEPLSALLRHLSEERMVELFRACGEGRWARRIAGAIVRRARRGELATTRELAETVLKALPGPPRRRRIHPATRVFLALRILVNRELEAVETFLETLPDILCEGGRCGILSFHSLEDRIVKEKFRAWESRPGEAGGALFRRLTKKVIRPTPEEVARNRLARSARLRVVEKL